MPYDIAVNITDGQYLGEYHQKSKHPCDIHSVINRAVEKNIQMVFLGTSVNSSIESVALGNEYGQYAAIGIHPGSAGGTTEEDVQKITDILEDQNIEKSRSRIRGEILKIVGDKALESIKSVIAIGEIGLDYYREYSPKEKQREVFSSILKKTAKYKIPYIFHYRDCEDDFFEIVREYEVEGVVHSFTGTIEEMHRLVGKGYYIGINGASIRENETTGVIEKIPDDRLLIETDAPWCTIRKTSKYSELVGNYLKTSKRWKEGEGVKGRNEPVNLLEVIDVVAGIRNISKEELVEKTDSNFKKLFKL
ncbi:TatD DNase family protein [Nematocida minor]|uniref:TatD DNase family protein n=1 Tax=Nematocida minor TaxID=1912983 RepID=UPI00221F1F27|nr:TatD DNase family protein [Nematocida minor]KAI5191521.1 TatD DNase family protein [Nematocida minor]